MSEVIVEERHGGTRRSLYFYVIVGREALHVSQLPGVEKVGEERGGKGLKIVKWKVPRAQIENQIILAFNFTSSGYLIAHAYRVPIGIEELNVKALGERLELVADDGLDYMVSRGVEFKLFGPEESMVELYKELVPSLVEDIRSTCSKIGLSPDLIVVDSPGLDEALKDPRRALSSILAVPSWQGRVKNLYERIQRVYEAWLLLRTIKPLVEEGAVLQKNYLVLESTALEPAAELKLKDRYISILYKPVLAASEDPSSRAMPTLLATVTTEKPRITSRDITSYAYSAKLAVLLKMNLRGETPYESTTLTVRQVRLLREKLREAMVAVTLIEPNPYAANKLNAHGVQVFNGLTPSSTAEMVRYENLVKDALIRKGESSSLIKEIIVELLNKLSSVSSYIPRPTEASIHIDAIASARQLEKIVKEVLKDELAPGPKIPVEKLPEPYRSQYEDAAETALGEFTVVFAFKQTSLLGSLVDVEIVMLKRIILNQSPPGMKITVEQRKHGALYLRILPHPHRAADKKALVEILRALLDTGKLPSKLKTAIMLLALSKT